MTVALLMAAGRCVGLENEKGQAGVARRTSLTLTLSQRERGIPALRQPVAQRERETAALSEALSQKDGSHDETLRKQILANFFVPQPLPALNAHSHRRFKPAPGVTAEAVTYATQFGMRVPAILYLPDPPPRTDSGKIPGFIVVNGHGGDKYSWYSFYTGILYARAGAAVLTYDQAGEGERNADRKSGTRAHDRIQGDAAMARRLAGLMITDAMQAVSYLSRRPEVDPKRIGAAGYSLGSFVLSLAGAVETRLYACVLVGGGNLDGPDGYWDNSKPMCQGFPYRSLAFLGDRGAAIYALHASRGPTLLWNGLADTVVAMERTGEPFFRDLYQRTVKLRGSAKGVFETGFDPQGSHRPYFLARPVALWLEKQLDFPNWTEASIRSMPETVIGRWAAQYNIPMDRLYASEDREGGLRALGAGVPGYAREDLSVFSLADWQRQKKQMVLETWLEAAGGQTHGPAGRQPKASTMGTIRSRASSTT
jgi:dienelactone hydrolase